MKILELFAGSRSIGEEAKRQGHEVFSVDINDFKGIDLVFDIEFLKAAQIPFIPDVIWASPPCTSYSIAAISHHRYPGTYEAKSDFAIKSDRVIKNLLKLIEFWGCDYYIENPRGCLRKMDFMQGLPRTTVWYCKYNDTRAKPTDIWSNNIYNPLFNPLGWKPRPECHNGNIKCHHEAAPRGSRTGTQGLSNNYERSKIPVELCREILSLY